MADTIIFLFAALPSASVVGAGPGVDTAANMGRLLTVREDDGQGIRGDVFHRHGAASGRQAQGGAREPSDEGETTNMILVVRMDRAAVSDG